VIHREPERRTKRMADALAAGRVEHPAQVLLEYASKAFNRVRQIAMGRTNLFAGLALRELPTLQEVRALSSHLYARAGYEVTDVQDLMAHTEPDMTRAYQKGHARKVLRVEMVLPWSVEDDPDDGVREEPPVRLHSVIFGCLVEAYVIQTIRFAGSGQYQTRPLPVTSYCHCSSVRPSTWRSARFEPLSRCCRAGFPGFVGVLRSDSQQALVGPGAERQRSSHPSTASLVR
jgi:hypothetical protein